jgi:flavodoxin I
VKRCPSAALNGKGCFDCQGVLAESLQKKGPNMTDEQWEAMLSQMSGHPDEDDVAAAKAFAKSVLD